MNAKYSEFELINNLFAPLAGKFPGALNLTDDAALLEPPLGYSVVVTADTIVSGVHFQPEDPPDLVAGKLIRVNLSDLAAMGAEPWTMVAMVALPQLIDISWITRFVAGMDSNGEEFGITLVGGDTVITPGPATFSLAAFGLVPRGKALRRSGAKPGDRLYVTGTVGDGFLGLQILTGRLTFTAKESNYAHYLRDRYYLPRPRINIGTELIGRATSCIDISDGLLQDLAHLCQSSKVGARLRLALIPLSPAAKLAAGQIPNLLEEVIAGGDDYELLFTSPLETATIFRDVRPITLQTQVTEIGEITDGSSIVVLDPSGQPLPLSRTGYQHFFMDKKK